MEKARILVADDNVSLCKTMSFILERKDYAGQGAPVGQQDTGGKTKGRMIRGRK